MLLAAVGCSKHSQDPQSSGRPPFTAALLPPAIAGLMPLHATEADVLAKFPAAKISPLTYNQRKCDALHVDAPIVWAHTEPPGPSGKVTLIGVQADGMCDWVRKHIAPLPGARRCPGNRVLDKDEYCLELDGHPVDVDCSKVTVRDDGSPMAPTDEVQYVVYFYR